jgi:hypothetical protein
MLARFIHGPIDNLVERGWHKNFCKITQPWSLGGSTTTCQFIFQRAYQ